MAFLVAEKKHHNSKFLSFYEKVYKILDSFKIKHYMKIKFVYIVQPTSTFLKMTYDANFTFEGYDNCYL